MPKELVFYTDEAGFSEHDHHRAYGYATRGQKVHGTVSGGRKERHNMIALLNYKQQVIAPRRLNGNVNTEKFNQYLCYALQKLPKKAVIVMDNARFHKIMPETELKMRQRGITVRFLPPYSPHLNPIEHVWAWAKKRLKRTIDRSRDFLINLYAVFIQLEIIKGN